MKQFLDLRELLTQLAIAILLLLGAVILFRRLLEASTAALDEAVIEMPFPHLQLFVDDVDERVWKKLRPLAERKAS